MKRHFLIALGLSTALLLYGCAATIPVSYIAQNFVRSEGRASIGHFTYEPADQGKVKANQIQNTAIGSIYLAVNVADLVQRATALELEKTGFVIGDDNPLRVGGNVLEFKANDLGYTVRWTYRIRYSIIRGGDSVELFSKQYEADPKTTGKFGLPSDYGPSINELILSGYNKFIRDEEVRNIFSQ